MASVNKAIIMGYLGRDPELRYTQAGRPVANFSVATTERWKSDGQQHEETEWHDCAAWGRIAETISAMLQKGSLVYIEGRIKSNRWEDRDGNKRVKKEIYVLRWQLLQGGKPKDDTGVDAFGGGLKEPPADYQPINEDDVPF